MKPKSGRPSRHSKKQKLPRLLPSKRKRKDSKRSRDWLNLLKSKESGRKRRDRDLPRRRLPTRPDKLSWKLSLPRQQHTRPSRKRLPSREG